MQLCKGSKQKLYFYVVYGAGDSTIRVIVKLKALRMGLVTLFYFDYP
ncbi:MAG: hypothetical protein LBV52_04085 [Spirochaetaceae bacterium]|nr:hypothetical protein [Spirochaetaceae bacterium]